MPKFFVRQPDGMFALFSTVVEDFHESGLTSSAMRELAGAEFRLSEAELDRVLSEAEKDAPFWDGENGQDGLNRWREVLARIMATAGPVVLSERMLEMGFDDLHVPPEVWALSGRRH